MCLIAPLLHRSRLPGGGGGKRLLHTCGRQVLPGNANTAGRGAAGSLSSLSTQQPISGTADPRSSQTGQVIRGLR